MVSAFGSSTDDLASGTQRNRRLHLAGVAAGLVFVVASAAAAGPHLLNSSDTRSVVPSATSTLAIAQSGGIGAHTTSEEPAGTSSRVVDEASSPPTTRAVARVADPATTQPDGAVVARCVDRELGASTTSTVHGRSPARSPSTRSAPTTTLTLCENPADERQSTVASSPTRHTQAGPHDSDRPSNTAPGRVGQPGPGSDSPSNSAPGRLDRPASDEAPALGRTHDPQPSDPQGAEERADDDDSEPGEHDSVGTP